MYMEMVCPTAEASYFLEVLNSESLPVLKDVVAFSAGHVHLGISF